ncbi:hypothetical protein NMG60_11022110 [Bertholletia excelsa]
MVPVVLVVNKSLWEHQHITKLEFLSTENVFSVYKSHFQSTSNKEEELDRAWVSVRWVNAPCRVLEYCVGHTLPEECRELGHGGFVHSGSLGREFVEDMTITV